MQKIDIKGHSGCNIEVIDDNGKLFVKKSSQDPSYIKRLHLQGHKQDVDSFSQNIVNVPHVKDYGINTTEGNAWILMDYIYAKNFIDYFEHASKADIDNFITTFCKYIEYELECCYITHVSKDVFINKFNSVSGNCWHNKLLINNSDIQNILTESEKIFNNLPDVIWLPVGKCHGDLTFSNILFTSNDFYFIDYLDSFIETPIQDIVKLRQDTLYLWSTQMYTKKYDSIRLKMIFNYIDNKINQYFLENEYYKESYSILQLMNILRILPYVKEESVRDFLIDVITNILNTMNYGE